MLLYKLNTPLLLMQKILTLKCTTERLVEKAAQSLRTMEQPVDTSSSGRRLPRVPPAAEIWRKRRPILKSSWAMCLNLRRSLAVWRSQRRLSCWKKNRKPHQKKKAADPWVDGCIGRGRDTICAARRTNPQSEGGECCWIVVCACIV